MSQVAVIRAFAHTIFTIYSKLNVCVMADY